MGKKPVPRERNWLLESLAFRSTAIRLSEGLQSRAETRALQDDFPMTEVGADALNGRRLLAGAIGSSPALVA